MPDQTTIVTCDCGARYERREVALPIKDVGCFDCNDCGARMEIWSGRKVPAFKRLPNDGREAKRA
jgi:hypothetical protein